MIISRFLKQRFTSILFTLFVTLQVTACSTEDTSSAVTNTIATVNGNTHKKTTSDTSQDAFIRGADSGRVREDEDPDGDNLLETSGKLNITDSDPGEAGFIAETVNGNYGSLTIDAAGKWSYAADNNQVIIQNLTKRDSLEDRLTVSSIDGTAHTIKITIKGENETNIITTDTNNAAVFSGDDIGSVTEDIDPDGDNLLEVSGKLNISDSDANEAAFIAATINGNYGNLVIDTAGNWHYAANNNQVIIQNLANGAKLTDSLTVSSVDSSTHTVVITILGTDEPNTPAVITGVNNGSVTEDVDPDGDNLLETGGKLNITDSDPGEAAFIAATVNGNYGNLVIDAAGNWRYAANNKQVIIQNLANGAKLTDRLTVSSVDNSTHTVVITILGTDEPNTPAVITGVNNGSVTEDVDPDGDNLLETGGKLNITDSDPGEAAFIAATVNGNYGNLVIDAAGNWRYAANNNQTVIQNLATGATLNDSLTVSSLDGTTHTIDITFTGVDEANSPAVITGINNGSVTEDIDPDSDNLLETGGKLNITDNDPGEAAFIAATINGNYGNLVIDTAGNWHYAADNNQVIIQNLVNEAKLTDSLTVSSVDGTTHKVVITIRGANEANPFAMYSYNANLSNAQPLSGAVLEQTTVYMFFNNTSQYSSMNFYCCKGIDGASTGEAHKTPVRDSSAPFVHSVDLSQYSTTGTRELYIDATRTDGSGLDSIHVNFSINTGIIPITPEPSANSPAVISGVNTGSVTEDVDPDGDNLLEIGGKLNITDSDAGEAAFIAATINANVGSLTISSTGNWNYAANNNLATIQSLNTGATLTVNLTVSSVDGTTHTIVITIVGVNDTNNNTATVSLSWVAPSAREDNQPISLADIDGYNVYYGTTSGQYPNKVTINDGTATGYTFINFPTGTHYFVVTTVDTDGRESQYSTVTTVN